MRGFRKGQALGQRFSIGGACTPWGCEKGLDGVREGIDVNDDNTKSNTSNGARGSKMIFLSGRGAGFKMN